MNSLLIASSGIPTPVSETFMTAAETALFAGGISNAYFWMAWINALAIIPSLLRGRRVEKTDALTREDLRDDAV